LALIVSMSMLETDSSDWVVESGLVDAPVPISCAGSESRTSGLDLGREDGWSVETALGSLSVRVPLGPHPEVMATIMAINPQRVGASRMAFDHFIVQSSHSVP